MSGINQITIVGHVGSAPELKFNKNNVPYCRFSVAVNEQWTKNGEKHEATTWFPVVVFNGLSEACATWLERGRLVAVLGRVRTREYDGNDGTHHRDMQVVADNVTFLGPAKRGDGAAPQPGRPPTSATVAVDDSDVPF
jgi:single-strand DNA-binding protein